MTIELKIEILKVFKLEFAMSSDNKKKKKEDVKENTDIDSSIDNTK